MADKNVKDQISLVTQYLAMRLETDPEYRERVKNDPESALRDAGLPEDIIRQSLANTGEKTVAGTDCTDFTCWSSECPGSCGVTVPTPTDWATGCV